MNRWRSSRSIDFSPCSRATIDRVARSRAAAISCRASVLLMRRCWISSHSRRSPIGVDQLIDQLVGQRRPADQAILDGAVVAVVLGDAPERGDRQLRAGVAGQARRPLPASPVSASRSDSHSDRCSRPATASAYCMACVRTISPRSSSLSTGLHCRSAARHLEIVAGEARRHAVRQVRARCHRLGERLAHVLLEVPDQQLEHRFGERARVALDQVVVLAAELGGERGARGGRRVALQGTHVGERKGLHAGRPGAVLDQLGAAPAGPRGWRVSAR